MTALPGVDRLLKALEAVEVEATDRNANAAAAETVAAAARPLAPTGPTGRAKRSIRASGTKAAGVVRAGGPSVPWVAPGVFGHGTPGNPRPQGGYMPANPWPFDAAGRAADDVIEIYHRRTMDALREQGLT
ncbi:MAG: hypothetical protein ACRCW4_13400 [Candidatus Neomicrothrix subdominans]